MTNYFRVQVLWDEQRQATRADLKGEASPKVLLAVLLTLLEMSGRLVRIVLEQATHTTCKRQVELTREKPTT